MKADHVVMMKAGIKKMLAGVKDAAVSAAAMESPDKKKILSAVAAELRKNRAEILRENAKDVRRARKNGLAPAMIDRLTLTGKRIDEMALGVEAVAGLDDPIGAVTRRWRRPNGLRISRVVVPIGVILIIYESRPNVTVECASLCLQSGNAVILRGGSEAFFSNRILAGVFRRVLRRKSLPEELVSFVETTDRRAVDFLLKRDEDIHLVIPRGGESLIRKVVRASRIPVIKHYQGICHVYVDEKADLKKAIEIVRNAKLQRPGVCNAAETLLVHRNIAGRFLPLLGPRLHEEGCQLRADRVSRRYLPHAVPSQKSDYGREFLDKILAVKTVSCIEEAVEHIRRYGSAHTDAIVTEDRKAAEIFKKKVDSSSVMVNASTRFSDGFQYGFGAEIGISTDKIHARGPMGLEGLTSYKYIVEGDGQIRS
jgi:glutamate-5-semialdehyde dehydrogenase